MMVLSAQEAYAILDLQTGASEDDIVNSYKNLALAWHPDKHSGSDLSFEEFYKINNAYRRLTITDESEISMPLTKEKMFEIFQDVFIKKKSSKQNGYALDFGEDDCNGDGFDDDFIGASYNNKNKNIGLAKKGEDKPSVTVEDAQRNADSLVAEVEKEKNKAERRRAKKKRRKEKRKSEKESSGGQQENKKDASNSAQVTPVKSHHASRSSSEDTESEEELDTKSPFIATAATKIKNINPLTVRNSNVTKFEKLVVRDDTSSKDHRAEDTDPSVLQSRRLAIRGNEMANVENFTAAVELFSEAIRINPKDFRFYGNRSFCYDRLGLYDKALKDADKAIQLNPEWPKNYHRKGRALAGLKKFAEAEVAFDHVLKLDKDCEDAKQELVKVRTEQILEMGFTKPQAESALRWFGSVPAALDSLLNGAGTSARTILDSLVAASSSPAAVPVNEVYVSDEENQNSPMWIRRSQPPHSQPDIKMDSRNPEGLTSLWVGNISKEIKEKTLKQLFGQYGTVSSLRIIPEKFCAFINYSDKNSAGRAMKALQGVMFGGQNLLIRFPDKPIVNGHPVLKKATTKLSVSASATASGKSQPKATGPVNGDECYFWRTTGCVYGDSCCYKHIPAHKGIDKKPWQTA